MEKELKLSKEGFLKNPLGLTTESGRGRRRSFKRLAWKIAGYSSLAVGGLLVLSAL